VSDSNLVTVAGTSAGIAAGEFAAGAAGFHGLGFVDSQFAAIMALAVQGVDGAPAFFGAAHGDEGEAARAAGHAVRDHVGFGDMTVLGEELVQVLFGGLEGKISHV
jgi:hypothetical protein